jgi:hypothetical protein
MARLALVVVALMLSSCATPGNHVLEVQEFQNTLLSIHKNKAGPELRKPFLGPAVRHIPVDFDSKHASTIVGYFMGDLVAIKETQVLGCGDAVVGPGDHVVHIKTHQAYDGKVHDFDLVYYIRQVDGAWRIIYSYGQ